MPESSGASFSDRCKAWAQYPLPHHAISRFTHWLTRVRQPALKNWMIRGFVRRFGVDMSEAANPDTGSYPDFNAFFTRPLRPGARPLVAGDKNVLCPVDGAVSQMGEILDGRIFQAKGRDFSALELLGGDAAAAQLFEGGNFATLYLSPKDYHRIHMPVTGDLQKMLHVPGRLFSVNPPTTRAVPRLFARNERVAAIFDSDAGPLALVLVGALNVASIETVWAGEVTPPQHPAVRSWSYRKDEVKLAKGSEMGRFNMGSTVVLLFARGRIRWEARQSGDAVRMGERLATLL